MSVWGDARLSAPACVLLLCNESAEMGVVLDWVTGNKLVAMVANGELFSIHGLRSYAVKRVRLA